jgi:hypothetical protein
MDLVLAEPHASMLPLGGRQDALDGEAETILRLALSRGFFDDQGTAIT